MKQRNAGFTLMELVVVMAVIGILSVSSLTTFYRSIRASARVELQKNLDAGAEHIFNLIGRQLRESQIDNLDGKDRIDCAVAGGILTGSSLTITTLNGTSVIYALSADNELLANGVALNNKEDILTLNSLSPLFTWTCGDYGVADIVKVSFKVQAVGGDGTMTVEDNYEYNVLLRNSGN